MNSVILVGIYTFLLIAVIRFLQNKGYTLAAVIVGIVGNGLFAIYLAMAGLPLVWVFTFLLVVLALNGGLSLRNIKNFWALLTRSTPSASR